MSRFLKKHFLFIFILCSCRSASFYKTQSINVSGIKINNKIKEDSAIRSHIYPYKVQLDSTMNEVIGYAPTELKKGIPESTMGNFLVDVLLEKSRQYSKKPVDLSLINNGGIRIGLPAGNITVGTIFEIMPFENELVILELDSGMVYKLFTYMAQRGGIPVANATYTFRQNKLMDFTIGGKPFDPDKTYLLAISDYLANGGDDLFFLTKAKNKWNMEMKIRNAIIEYIKDRTKEGNKITARIEGRVKMLE